MSTQHTPGPWSYHANGDANHYCILREGKRWVVSFLQNGEIWTPEQEANARLIAAAPDMLAAAKLALAPIIFGSVETGRHIPRAAWDALRAAIAKAEGGGGAMIETEIKDMSRAVLLGFVKQVARLEHSSLAAWAGPGEFEEDESWTDDQAEDSILTVNRLIDLARAILAQVESV